MLTPGFRAKFFHPGTFGVMLEATVLEQLADGRVRVRFDVPFPGSTKRVFVVPANYN